LVNPLFLRFFTLNLQKWYIFNNDFSETGSILFNPKIVGKFENFQSAFFIQFIPKIVSKR